MTFKPTNGLDNLTFNMKEQEVLEMFGAPNSMERRESLSNDSHEISLYYNVLGCNIDFYYDDKTGGSYMNIFLEKSFFYSNEDWFLLSKNEIFERICKIYKEKFAENAELPEFKEKNNTDLCEYEFPEIGISLWFNETELEYVAVYQPVCLQ